MLGGLSAPDGPDLPFGDPILAILDAIRVLLVFVPAAINVFAVPYVLATREMARGQISRFSGLALLSAAAFGTELDHFGDYANYRLALHAIGVSLLSWGVFRMILSTRSPVPRS